VIDFSALSGRSLAGRGLRGLLRLVPSGTSVRVLQGPLRGARWIVGSGTHGCWLGSYERRKQEAFAASIRPGQVVFDAGAHVGFYTLLASRRVGAEGAVVAFEPLPRNLAYLREHVRLNGVRNVEVVDAAVGEQEGVARFREGPNSSSGAVDAGGALEAPMVTLDSFVACARAPRLDVIKMDIEGGEAAALRGGLETLRRFHPVVFLATHGPDAHAECLELLSSLGYGLGGLRGDPVDSTDEVVATWPGRD
jgi:FkbM family methyltransferase